MESRRARLIVLAYLRGYKDLYRDSLYGFGTRTLLRREVILSALSDELEAGYVRDASMLNAGLISCHISDNTKLNNFNKRAHTMLKHAYDKYELTNKPLVLLSDEQQLLKDSEALIKAWNDMKERGIIT